MRRPKNIPAAVALVATLGALLASCGGERVAPPTAPPSPPTTPTTPATPPPPPPSPIALVEVLGGSGQRAAVGTSLAEDVVVRVRRRDGSPARGVALEWQASAGTVRASPTDSVGVARAVWTLGTSAGTQTLVVGADSIETTVAVTALPGPPAGVTIVEGDRQAGEVATTLPAPVGVRLTDAYLNVVPNARVRWTADGGGSTSDSVTLSDVVGVARVAWTLGTRAGAGRLTAETPDAASPAPNVTVTATIRAGAAARIEAVSGDAQDGPFGSWLLRPLVVRVSDRYDNPVSGATVAFSPEPGTGAVSAATVSTDAAGLAADSLRLPIPFARFSVTAGVVGPGVSVRFTATSRAATFVSVSARVNRTCALSAEGVAYCWGDNLNTGLGLGPNGTSRFVAPPTPVDTRERFRSIDVGEIAVCAVSTTDALWCWGRQGSGIRLFDLADPGKPVLVPAPAPVTSVTAGGHHMCALMRDGSVGCFSENSAGAGGPLRTWFTSGVVVPLATSLRFTQITGTEGATCGVATDGVGYCWGVDLSSGRLGIPTPRTSCTAGNGVVPCAEAPTAVFGTKRFRSISQGWFHTCALGVDAAAYCWGKNDLGQLGDGTQIDRAEPTRVAIADPLEEVWSSVTTSCALSVAGEIYCWGQNAAFIGTPPNRCPLQGQTEPVTDCRTTPAKVPTRSLRFVSIRSDASSACGIATDHVLYCWGTNGAGNVGDGTLDNVRTQPTRVGRQP